VPYYKEIRAFRQQDSLQFPASNQILFIGSSTFTRWTDVQQYFPGYKILNRAFGGSSLLDLIRYRYEVIYAYQPKQIVMYCGENDFANSDTVTVAEMVQRFKTLFRLIRAKHPQVPFVYVSIKPSLSRQKLFPKYIEANRLIRQYLSAHKQTRFVDVYTAMLQANGQPNASIFSDDSLHMNSQGYRIWQKKLQPVLIK
jgi:lysophospholipase L1-like esterase